MLATDTATPAHGRSRSRMLLDSVAIVLGGLLAVLGLAYTAFRQSPSSALALLGLLLLILVLVLRRVQPVDLLVIATLLLLLVPARYRIAPLGAAGTPASLLGILTFLLWGFGVVLGRPWLCRHRHPLRWALTALVLSVLASYVAVGFRAHDALESKAADRGLLTLVAIVGVAALAADVIQGRDALRRVIEALVAGGAVVAALGVIQFETGLDLANVVRLPGFTFVPSGYSDSRSGFVRIVSTASHPIELSVMLAMILPLAIWLGFNSTGRYRRWWWVATGVIAAAVPMTVSRTGVLGLLVALAVLLPGWPWRRRGRVLLSGAVGVVAMRLVIPGLIGTLRSFIFSPGQDPSLLSRQAGRDTASRLFGERPFLGRGFGTFLPDRYSFLDNQVLLSLVETGILGLLALGVVFGTAVWLGLATRGLATGSTATADRELALALLASLAVSVSTWFTYDALSFPTSRALTFLVVGCLAAFWRIATEASLLPAMSEGRL